MIAVDDTPINQDLGSGSMTANRLLEMVPTWNRGFVPIWAGKETQHIMRLTLLLGQFATS